MFTLRAAAALLQASASIDGVVPVARAMGFTGECTPLDQEARSTLGLPETIGEARLAAGPGSLRALLFTLAGDAPRDELTRVAGAITNRGPHILWVLMAVNPLTHTVIVGIPLPARRGVRVAALIVDRRRVMDSDAETIRMLAAARSEDDLATHARFAEILGRDALSRSFFRRLEACVDELATSAGAGPRTSRREVALLYASRLLFLGFLESKGWLDDDAAFLTRGFDDCMATGGQFHSRVLLPLFFGTLNTPSSRRSPRARRFGRIPFLNGGLFTRTPIERRSRSLRFSDEACGRFFGELLSRYRFTSREETASFEEAAIDPEMLGRTFECLMAADSRRSSGAFYTPQELVARVTDCGLEAALAPRLGAAATRSLLGGEPPVASSAGDITAILASLRVLDPSCGSGAFLVHVLDRLAQLRQLAGDRRPADAIRRDVLARSIFGVDVNPTAVWLCQLRLWLSIVIETRDLSGTAVAPLPNLDRNVRIGDSLSGSGFGEAAVRGAGALRTMRERYARSTGRRKATLARALDREERRMLIEATSIEIAAVTAARRDHVAARRGRDLFGGRYHPSREEMRYAAELRDRSLGLRRRLRDVRGGGAMPFTFCAHFADVASDGGFSLVIGNPPWVRPHHVDPRTREELRRSFTVARSAPWTAGALASGAGRGFSAQVDLAAVFVERSLRLLAPDGALSLLLPSKLWRSLSAGGLRALMTAESRIVRIEDYADVPAAFDAAVYPGLLVAARTKSGSNEPISFAVLHRARHAATWSAPPASLPWDASPGSPWLLIPPEVRRAFEMLRGRGVAMSESVFGRPLLGVKCGLNEAFIVRRSGGEGVVVAANGREGGIDPEWLRPALRGEHVRPWSSIPDADHIVWTHGVQGAPLATLPATVLRWLAPHRKALAGRADARHAPRWWTLFRTEGAATDKPRVVWADIGVAVRATVIAAGDPTVPLNTCYVARCPTDIDALALAAILNSEIATAWLSVIAEPARGGYRRYLGWTMSLLPLPARWEDCRIPLSEMGRRAMAAPGTLSAAELSDAVVRAYGLRRRDVDPLLAWTAR